MDKLTNTPSNSQHHLGPSGSLWALLSSQGSSKTSLFKESSSLQAPKVWVEVGLA